MTFNRSEMQKARWADPEGRARIMKGTQDYWASPRGQARLEEAREKREARRVTPPYDASEAARLRWADPEKRKNMLEGRWGPGHVKKVEVPKVPRVKRIRAPRGMVSKHIRCGLRKSPPQGPLTLCGDLGCFEKCVDLTKSTMGKIP